MRRRKFAQSTFMACSQAERLELSSRSRIAPWPLMREKSWERRLAVRTGRSNPQEGGWMHPKATDSKALGQCPASVRRIRRECDKTSASNKSDQLRKFQIL